MTYNPNTPIANDSPKISQPEILANFGQIATVMAVNHVAFNLANQGNHKAVILNTQTADPGVFQDQVTLYGKNVTSTTQATQPQLFIRLKYIPPGPSLPMQLVYNKVINGGPIYQSFLVGGYLIYFGTVTGINGSTQVTLSANPPSGIIGAWAQARGIASGQTATGNPVSTTIQNPNKFTIFGPSLVNTIVYNFTVIGIQ